jgi:mRNA-degrading endonuclease YafQ of YafQ-DinJ toxin-antitoxin module
VRQPAPAFQTLEITEQYKEAVASLQEATRKQVAARARLLFENPAHSSLKAHSIKPDKHYWEAYVNRGDRIIYIPEGSHLVLVDVVTHDEISRYSKRPPQK